MLKRKHIPILRLLSRKGVRRNTRRALLNEKEVLHCVCECVLNTLNGVVPLSEKRKNNLSAYKKELRLLANKTISKNKKKRIIVQKGGAFLPMLLTPAISLLSTLLSRNDS